MYLLYILHLASSVQNLNVYDILMDKIKNINLLPTITKWLAAFLTNRQQFVKLGDKPSPTLHMKGIFPQGTLLGMEGFPVN